MKKLVLSVIALLLITSTAFAEKRIRFGVPPWPGITVKTEVVTQIIEAMGHKTEQKEVGPPIIYKGLTINQLDVFLAAWTPHQNDMLNPLVEQGKVDRVTANLPDSSIGLCVPDYVWDSGVHSFGDLDTNADRFKKIIYNIEPGSGMNNEMASLIEKNVAGLGDWEQVGSTTSAMLSQVGAKIKKNKWVAFGCWSPHWMNIQFDIRFLQGVPGTEKFISSCVVYTVTSKDFHSQFPQVYKFLKQFELSAEIQSQWVHSFGYEEIEPKRVAREWIAANLDQVDKWLTGVKAKDGKPAIEAVRKSFKTL